MGTVSISIRGRQRRVSLIASVSARRSAGYFRLRDRINLAILWVIYPVRTTDQEIEPASQSSFFYSLRNFLAKADSPKRSDVIFVLAGRPERKVYGLQLFREQFASRL